MAKTISHLCHCGELSVTALNSEKLILSAFCKVRLDSLAFEQA